jgi:ribosomal protein L37AE/L43A
MIYYRFVCPNCKDENETVEEIQYGINRYAHVQVDDYGSGPELYELEPTEYYNTSESVTVWRCVKCNWVLPCKTPNEVVDFIVDQEVDRRT